MTIWLAIAALVACNKDDSTDTAADTDTDTDTDSDTDTDTDADTDSDTDTVTDTALPYVTPIYGPYEPTWAGVEQMFVDHCDRCHPSVAGFSLHDAVYADVYNGNLYFVVPGSANTSFLNNSIDGSLLPGWIMPQDRETPLPASETAHVAAWINAGAPLD